MPGNGKYTKYAPEATAAHTLLNKLFRTTDAKEAPPTQDLVGKEADARAAVLAIATAKVQQGIGGLQPSDGVQQGDLMVFPNGVNLDFSGKLASIQAPDTTEGKDVVWKNPGDPANAYVPDITSPGPGKTSGLDKTVDPQIAVKDIKPNYVAGAPGTGTESPTTAIPKLTGNDNLGNIEKLGDSGGNP